MSSLLSKLPHLAVDLGGSTLRFALSRGGSSVTERSSVLLPDHPQQRLRTVLDVLGEFRGVVAGAGIAVAGTVSDGVLVWSANLGLSEVPLAALVAERLGTPVALINDARAAGLAEARTGLAAEHDLVLALTVGTGIGGALIHRGELVQGSGDAGEVGHMRLDPEGFPCGCGRTGCWETTVGGKALARRAADVLGVESVRALTKLEALARADNPLVTAFLDEIGQDFARGIDALCAVLAPDAIILGGGVMARRGAVAGAYLAGLAELRWRGTAVVLSSSLGDDAGLIGAGMQSVASQHPIGGIVQTKLV